MVSRVKLVAFLGLLVFFISTIIFWFAVLLRDDWLLLVALSLAFINLFVKEEEDDDED